MAGPENGAFVFPARLPPHPVAFGGATRPILAGPARVERDEPGDRSVQGTLQHRGRRTRPRRDQTTEHVRAGTLADHRGGPADIGPAIEPLPRDERIIDLGGAVRSGAGTPAAPPTVEPQHGEPRRDERVSEQPVHAVRWDIRPVPGIGVPVAEIGEGPTDEEHACGLAVLGQR
jgi:hypothetical protein